MDMADIYSSPQFVGAVRVGYVDDALVINPTRTQMIDSSLDLIVTGCEKNKVGQAMA